MRIDNCSEKNLPTFFHETHDAVLFVQVMGCVFDCSVGTTVLCCCFGSCRKADVMLRLGLKFEGSDYKR